MTDSSQPQLRRSVSDLQTASLVVQYGDDDEGSGDMQERRQRVPAGRSRTTDCSRENPASHSMSPTPGHPRTIQAQESDAVSLQHKQSQQYQALRADNGTGYSHGLVQPTASSSPSPLHKSQYPPRAPRTQDTDLEVLQQAYENLQGNQAESDPLLQYQYALVAGLEARNRAAAVAAAGGGAGASNWHKQQQQRVYRSERELLQYQDVKRQQLQMQHRQMLQQALRNQARPPSSGLFGSMALEPRSASGSGINSLEYTGCAGSSLSVGKMAGQDPGRETVDRVAPGGGLCKYDIVDRLDSGVVSIPRARVRPTDAAISAPSSTHAQIGTIQVPGYDKRRPSSSLQQHPAGNRPRSVRS